MSSSFIVAINASFIIWLFDDICADTVCAVLHGLFSAISLTLFARNGFTGANHVAIYLSASNEISRKFIECFEDLPSFLRSAPRREVLETPKERLRAVGRVPFWGIAGFVVRAGSLFLFGWGQKGQRVRFRPVRFVKQEFPSGVARFEIAHIAPNRSWMVADVLLDPCREIAVTDFRSYVAAKHSRFVEAFDGTLGQLSDLATVFPKSV